MKALRLFYCLTALSAIWAALVSSHAQEPDEAASTKISVRPHDCARMSGQMLEEIKASPDHLNEALEKAILKSKHCTCELLTAAIQASGGSAQEVKVIVSTALKSAGEMSSAIAECAVIAAPAHLEVIREAFAEVQSTPVTEKPTPVSEKQSPAKAKIGNVIKKIVPGWKTGSKAEGGGSLVIDSVTPSQPIFRQRPSRKKIMLGTEQPSDEGGEALESQRLGFADQFNQMDFSFRWPELSGNQIIEQTGVRGPPRWFAYVDNGFDSNVNTAPADSAHDSYFVGGGLGAYFAQGTQDSHVDVRARFGVRYDDNTPLELDNLTYRGHLLADLEHQVSERLRVSDQIAVSYDVEPDFLSGETTGFRTDQYVFAYNRLAFAYRWARHFSTRSYYTVSTIQYEDGRLKMQEDRWRHLLGQQFRFLLDNQQTAFLEYRYGQTNFQRAPNDSQSHYFIGGVDYEISPDLKGLVAGGAERRSFERFSDQWKPYAEASFQAQWRDRTRFRWGARLGFEDAEVGAFRDRYSFRTGLAIDQDLSGRLKASLGFFYLHSDFDTGGQDIEAYTEDAVMLQLGLSYALSENLDLYLAYHFTNYDSGDSVRSYDRHRVNIGLNSHF